MVIGSIIFQFKLNQTEQGEIEPEFEKIVEEMAHLHSEERLESLITTNDRFRLFYNHTTGMHLRKGNTSKNFIIGRLKETPYKCLSYYHQEIDETQFLILTLFEQETEIELFEPIFVHMVGRITPVFEEMIEANLKSYQVVERIQSKMLNELKFAIFQIERLSNLTKAQKVGLIFSTFERRECLKILREGPISRSVFNTKMQDIQGRVSIDHLLTPFIELNVVRRDWARGHHDRKLSKITGEGEYLFLIKDLALVRKPPQQLIADMKSNTYIGPEYLKAVNEFYEKYDPFSNLEKESEILAKFILDPDIYDFLAFIQTRTYPTKKIPNVLSEFTDISYVLKRLQEEKIIKIIKDNADREWICLLAEITPITIFPTYLLNKISDRSSVKTGSIDKTSLFSPISKEVATIALDLLESTYNEQIEF